MQKSNESKVVGKIGEGRGEERRGGERKGGERIEERRGEDECGRVRRTGVYLQSCQLQLSTSPYI